MIVEHSGQVVPGRRGRPRQSPEAAERARAHIVAASGEVFAEHGSRGSNVALIIERAGIARPTFYRYFGNAEEPLHILLDAADRTLVTAIRHAVAGAAEGLDIALRVIDGYLDWARTRGPILRPLFAELHDPASPVSVHRERALSEIRTIIVGRMRDLGRAEPAEMDLDALLHACEYVVYRIAAQREPDDCATAEARMTMVRIALATLGMPADLERAMAVPGIFEAKAAGRD